ncbi:6-phosphogluconate dehydrogenase [Haematococcus lacustris]
MAVKCADIAKDGSPMERVAPGKTRLGFAGIGIMGLAMARNLLAAGYAVNVWNRNASKCSELVEAGAQLSSSPAELARQSDVTFAMLSDPPAALAVACGPQGVAAGLAPGKGYVDVSTVDAATSAAIAQAVRSAGALFLEAPVSGSKKPAEDGKLIFLAAGDKALFDAATPALDVMGKASFYLGEVGAGANMKLVVNMIMGSTMVAFAEGLALAGKAGLKQADVLEVLGLGAVAAPMFAMKGPAMIQSDSSFPPAFPLKHQQKDMRLAITLGDELAQPLPLAAAANSVYVQARGQGLGELDFSAVIRAVLAQQQAGNA